METFQLDKLKVKVIDPEEKQLLLHDEYNAIVLNNFGTLEDARKVKRFLSSPEQPY